MIFKEEAKKRKAKGKGKKPSKAPPSGTPDTDNKGNLECFTKYKYGDNADRSEKSDGSNGFFLEVSCYDVEESEDGAPEYQTTGCMSFSENKYRSGESVESVGPAYGSKDNRCRTFGTNGDAKFIGLLYYVNATNRFYG